MNSQTLRPYQSECVRAVLDAQQRGVMRVLYTLCTGAGKTTTFSELIKIYVAQGKRVLVLAHRVELITQAYKRIKAHCHLDEWEIGTEIAEYKATRHSLVIVGSVQTVKSSSRMPGWSPDVIITDECHHASSASYLKVFDRYGVGQTCFHIGCTATAKRSDRTALFAKKIDGSPVMLFDKKTQKKFEADASECVYDQHVYEFSIVQGIDGGYLVPLMGHSVRTETDLSKVKKGIDGDFAKGELSKAVLNAERTITAINAWKTCAENRSTLVFCASVEHAYHSRDLWRQAGYTAEAIDGETESAERFQILERFQKGELQVLCNMGILTEGTDIPGCGCVVLLRPTKSWSLYVQMVGRGLRTLPGVIDSFHTDEDRKSAIWKSAKPDCIVLDVVDICDGQDVCTAPSILDLPANLDLQGNSLTEAAAMMEEFKEVQERVIGECPLTYEELKVRLEQVDLLRKSGATSSAGWRASSEGFRYASVLPGYTATMTPQGEEMRLHVSYRGETLYEKTGAKRGEFKDYLDKAAECVAKEIRNHKDTIAPVSRGTLDRLSDGQLRVLRKAGHTDLQIDAMPYKKATGEVAVQVRALQTAPALEKLSAKQVYILTSKAGFSVEQLNGMTYPHAKGKLDAYFAGGTA